MSDWLNEAMQTAKRKFLKNTFKFILNKSRSKKFIIQSTYPPITNIHCIVKKGIRCYKIKTNRLNIVDDFVKYQSIGYGFFNSFTLNNENVNWSLINGLHKAEFKVGQGMVTEGEIWNLGENFIKTENKYFRLILSRSYNPNKRPSEYIQSEKFRVDESLRMSGLIEINCNNSKFHLFDYNYKKNEYLFIDSVESIRYDEFQKSASAILYSYGIISGSVPRDEEFILQSDDNDFNAISGFYFRRLEDSIDSGMEVVSEKYLRHFKDIKYPEGYVSNEVFSNLVTISSRDKRFIRALKIISEANVYPLEIRAASYSVGLETIKNIIIEENEENINPIKNKKLTKELISKFKNTIDQLDEINFNNKKAVKNRIEQINQITNKDSFVMAFKLCNFHLTDLDKEALQKRNDFLHGRIPFEDELEERQQRELKLITFKLHFLVTALIMKYCNFSGFLKNNPKFFSVLSNEDIQIDEPIFRKV